MASTPTMRYLGLLFALASTIQADSSNCQAVQPSFPSNFQCNDDKHCISTDSASTAICCDAGSSCSAIAPITCDIQQQNASAVDANTSQIFTIRLGDTLPTCGTNTCCPFGFSCTNSASGSPFCAMIIAQSSLNNTELSSSSTSASSAPASTSTSTSTSISTSTPSTSTSASSTSASTSTSSASASASATSASASTTTTGAATASSSPKSADSIDSSQTPVQKQNSFPPGVFIAGIAVGIVIGVLAALTWVVCTGRHKKADKLQSSTSSTTSKRPIISAPIPFPNNSRTDFIRRAANKTRSVFSTRAEDHLAQDSAGWNARGPTPPLPFGDNRAPFTPPAQQAAHRKASVETIQVYSPPGLIQHPSAVVPPLRTLSRQRQPQRGLDHPFQTPPKMAHTESEPNEVREGERVIISRYPEVNENDLVDKRGTTFTTMMAQCGIPDGGDHFPVGKASAPYETRYRI